MSGKIRELKETLFEDMPVVDVTFSHTRTADGGFFKWLSLEVVKEYHSFQGLGLSLERQVEASVGLHPMLVVTTNLRVEQHLSPGDFNRFVNGATGEQEYRYETCFGSMDLYAHMLIALDMKVTSGRSVMKMETDDGSRYYVTSAWPGESFCRVILGREKLRKFGATA